MPPRAHRELPLYAALVCAVALAALVVAQPVPLPNTYDAYLRIGNIDAQVTLEAFVDLLCPDCAQADPVLQQVAAHYGATKLQLIYHIFPLPYHTWAFTGAFGANVIRSLNNTDAAALAWINYMFSGGQENFWDDGPVQNMTTLQIYDLYASTAAQVTGVNAQDFLNGLQDDNLNENTRISWKFACSRGVTGTPSLFVNGLPVQADSTWTLAEWQQLLDPLFAAPQKTRVRLTGRSMAAEL
jgi:hypothetical protein